MNNTDAIEQAYRNGYEDGKRDAVKRGYWINDPPYRTLDGRYFKAQECSVCHSVFVSDGNTPYSNHPYCCECGAKMDGEPNA